MRVKARIRKFERTNNKVHLNQNFKTNSSLNGTTFLFIFNLVQSRVINN